MVYNVERNSHPSLFSFKYMYKKYKCSYSSVCGWTKKTHNCSQNTSVMFRPKLGQEYKGTFLTSEKNV